MIIRVIWHRAVATTGAQKRPIPSSRHGLEGGAFNAVRASDDGGHFEASRIRATGCPSQVQAWQRSTRRARRVPLHQSCNLPVGRAGYKSSTAVGKWKASSCEPPRQTGRRLPQTAAAYRSTPYQVTGRKARATSRQGKSHRYWVFWLLSERPARLLSTCTLRPEGTLVRYQGVPVN
jgi:hypothetical protein